MAIISGIPVLNCHLIEDTLLFYQQLFQFVVVKKRELEGALVWVHLMHGDTTLMLQRNEPQQTKFLSEKNEKISLYFFIDNIDELHHLIKAKNYSPSNIKSSDYQMQEFSVSDPEGNTITVGQKV